MDSTPPARLLNTLQTQTSGGSIMLQLHLSPRHSPRGPAPSRVSPIWTRGSTSKCSDARPRHSYPTSCSNLPLPACLPTTGVGLCDVRVGGSFCSAVSYLMVFEDASGFPPHPPVLLYCSVWVLYLTGTGTYLPLLPPPSQRQPALKNTLC